MITNEIGSLIESVIRYAKDHNPVSDRYKRVCDEFLSLVYSPHPASILINDQHYIINAIRNGADIWKALSENEGLPNDSIFIPIPSQVPAQRSPGTNVEN